MKKFLALLLSAALLLGLCACAAPAESETDYSGQTLAGKITALSGSTATLRLGQLLESVSQSPSGEAPTGEPPEMPSDEAPIGEPPEKPSGEAPTGEPPEKPSGEAPTGEPPEKPSGETPSGEAPSGSAPSQTTTTFTPNGETLTVDLSGALVEQDGESASLSVLAVGTTLAENLTVKTAGSSTAAIRSDRGGGTVSVSGGSYETSGLNSPAVYSTAAITVENATLTATGSEALVIEGKNSITLNNCTVSGHMSEQGSSADENIHTVMIYQSMSGDAAVGSSSFEMTGGSLTGEAGDLIYVTNTAATISLSGATLVQKDPSGALLRVCGNSGSRGWGTAGQNGAQVTLTASNQTLEGDIVVDSISSLDLTLKNGSTFRGTLSGSTIALTVEEGSTLILTGDSTAASLEGSGTIQLNGYTLTLADGTVLR